MSGAKHKGPRPVGEPAWPGRERTGLEHPRIRTARAPFALARAPALRYARNPAENRAKGAPQDVRRFARGETDALAGNKRKSEGMQPEQQDYILRDRRYSRSWSRTRRNAARRSSSEPVAAAGSSKP